MRGERDGQCAFLTLTLPFCSSYFSGYGKTISINVIFFSVVKCCLMPRNLFHFPVLQGGPRAINYSHAACSSLTVVLKTLSSICYYSSVITFSSGFPMTSSLEDVFQKPSSFNNPSTFQALLKSDLVIWT